MKKMRSWCEPDETALLTDLYHLTTAQSFHAEKMNEVAAFELYFRSLPDKRNYLVASGISEALDYLEAIRFTDTAVNYLASLAQFSPAFLDWLAELRFTGDVYAVPEGTIVFAQEPVLQVVAPLIEAQIVKSFLVNMVHYQTLVASKAARVVTAAGGRSVIDFGMRHTHGPAAAMLAAKAGYVSGIEATSNVLAGKEYGIPVAGTMGHAYVQSHDDEGEAFREFVRLYPETTLLVDTYDTLEGVRKVASLAKTMGKEFNVRAVRLDSGDLVNLSEEARRILDEAGLEHVRIIASGNLDEYGIARIATAAAPVDAFGVGTRLGVSQDAPYLDSAYKLVEYRGEGRLKLGDLGAATLPWRKQVFRQVDGAGGWVRDVIARYDERLPGTPLLEPVMRAGERLPGAQIDLQKARARVRGQLEALPPALLALAPAVPPYEVVPSPLIVSERDRLAGRFSWTPES
ncbi:MAG: nicotinate phosphoribosyltransferase [Proteobacteria bacterium]|jgi:nicotinate phosphoribosyltransferase|nr:nicotinate phosphoribosyltransferase [Pseudomonadota bacterium]